MTDTAPDFTRACAWSGEDTPGKHYVLTTTEGQEIVSEQAFRDPGGAAAKVDELTRAVKTLTARVRQLEGGKPSVPQQRKRTADAAE